MLYLLDYGGGNVASLANSLTSLGIEFKWVETVEDIQKASVSRTPHLLSRLPLTNISPPFPRQKILFPGVGSFGSALSSLRSKGFAEPLKAYIESGRPYMGICIGMQALFTSSSESPSIPGLGIIPSHIGQFSKSDKTVPCIGWNGATPLNESETSSEREKKFGFESDASYYFVHSYRAEFLPEVEEWALTVTRYGDEVYVSSVMKGNVFATQFHPEKSGQAGLNVLKAWVEQKEGEEGRKELMKVVRRSEEEVSKDLVRKGFTKRIVACLDVRANDAGDLVVTKGDQYDVRESEPTPSPSTSTSASTPPLPREVRNLGKPVDLARRYFSEGADEICFLNITSFRSCPLHDQPMLDVVRQSAATIFVPLTIGGGIKDTVDPDGTKRTALDVASTYFRCGADKVSIGSDAVFAVEALLANDGVPTGTSGIEAISYAYGAQALVVSVDPRRVYARTLEEIPLLHRPNAVDLSAPLRSTPNVPLSADLGPNGERYCWYQCTVAGGRESRDLDVVQLSTGVEKLGAGEILLNSVDRDGSGKGFDLRLVDLVRSSIKIPVVASSGAGRVEDFGDVFEKTGVEAALAAGIFHRREVPIGDVKEYLRKEGVPVRKDLKRE